MANKDFYTVPEILRAVGLKADSKDLQQAASVLLREAGWTNRKSSASSRWFPPTHAASDAHKLSTLRAYIEHLTEVS